MRYSVKKLRGGRRYYRRLAAEFDALVLDLSPESWFDLWHVHADWGGYGLRSIRHRRAHLRCLVSGYRRVLAQIATADRPVEAFLQLAPPQEAQQDALYVHTPNPNGTPFPHPFSGTTWGVPPPHWAVGLLDPEWQTGVTTYDGRLWYSVRATAGRGRFS